MIKKRLCRFFFYRSRDLFHDIEPRAFVALIAELSTRRLLLMSAMLDAISSILLTADIVTPTAAPTGPAARPREAAMPAPPRALMPAFIADLIAEFARDCFCASCPDPVTVLICCALSVSPVLIIGDKTDAADMPGVALLFASLLPCDAADVSVGAMPTELPSGVS